MRSRSSRSTLVLVAALCTAAPIAAQDKLVVGTKQAEPFSVRHEDGTWSGLSIDLWREVATRLEVDYELVEMDLEGLLGAIDSGQVDAAVAALTVTPEREARFDFTHPYYTSGLGIAVRGDTGEGLVGLLSRVVSMEFVRALGALAAVLMVTGVLLWLFERKRNPEQFAEGASGLGDAVWWSAVTMTTVGYGDRVPITFLGRMVALVWMFTSVVVISGFTAAIASALTIGQLTSAVSGPDDLPGLTVGAIAGSTGESYLVDRRIRRRAYESTPELLAAVDRGEVDAAVHDAPLLRYWVHNDFQGDVGVLPGTFVRQDYAIGLPDDSPYREAVNQVILELIGSDIWADIQDRHLGES